MSPALSSQSSARPWWSRSKPSKEPLRANRSFSSLADDSEKYSPVSPTSPKHKDGLPSLKFNTLASAIGLKSKKLPALTIQDPPSPVEPSLQYNPQSRPGTGSTTPSTADHSPFFTNRPPAKSVSTVRSSEYDFDAASDPHTTSEPRTPSDHPRDRMSYQTSVMTFTEIDPFASGGIVVQHLPQDPNRLSVYSDSSMLDPHHQKRGDAPHHRRSYGSSSSNSHGTSSDGQAFTPLSPSSLGRSPTASRSAYDLTQPNDAYTHGGSSTSGRPTQRTRRTKTPSGSNSSNSTVTPEGFRNRMNEPSGPNHIPRKRSSPSLRPRGMTVGAVNVRERDARPDVPRNVQSPDITLSPIQPLQVRRKPSSSSSPSSPNTPSSSPVTFTRHRNDSIVESPVEPSPTRPLVLVRKASSSRVKLPPLHSAPPMSDLPPPPPVPRSRHRDYDLSPLEFRNSSSSSLSLNFAPSIDGYHDIESGDSISQLMHNAYDLGPFEMREQDPKGKRRSHRNTYILDGDLSPTASLPTEPSLPSPLSKFPPVPAFVNGDLAASRAGKLLKKMSSQQNLGQRNSAASYASSASHDDMSTHGYSSGKHARKQRSFHHPRMPLPPLPGLRGGSSAHPSASAETLPAPTSPVVEPRRSSITSPRKRLFSGSSARRSTSSHGPTSPSTEDDGRSILSLDTESRPGTSSATDHITLSFGSAGAPLSLMTKNACISPSSMWEDKNSPGGADVSVSSKRTSQSEYVPQYIMSPAEQLALAEKLVDEETSAREQRVPEPEPERKPKLDLQPGDFGLAFLGGKNQSQSQRQDGTSRSVRSRSNSVLSYASTGTLAFGNGGGSGNGARGNGMAGEFGPGSSMTRGASLLSTSSKSASGWHGSTPNARPATSPRTMSVTESVRGGGPARSASMLARNPNKPPPLSTRPSTAQPALTPPKSPTTFSAPPTHSPETSPTSLPPPPRRKPSRHDIHEPGLNGKRASIVPINPLSPPPVRPRPRRQPSNEGAASQVTASRPPSAFDRQKVLQRRSLMRKPSFLDIEDEADLSAENDDDGGSDDESRRLSPTPPSPRSPSMESSFLDMDRKDSFDTVRSAESAFCVY